MITNFEISALGVEEMSNKEMKAVDGGFWGFIGNIIFAIAWDMAMNPEDTAESFSSGYAWAEENLN